MNRRPRKRALTSLVRQTHLEQLETRTLLTTTLAPMVQFSDPSVHIGDMSDTVSQMTRHDDSVSMQVEASQLTPGDAVTAWWVVFNNPEFCGGPCGVNDLGTPEVEAALVYADGQVVDADGRATFASTLVERDISYVDPAHTGLSGAGIGLSDAQATEVHVVLRTHGAASDDAAVRTEQLTSFNGGCAPECINLQGTEHLAVGRHVSLAPMVQFSDPSVHIGDKSDTVSRMTRDDDSVSVQVEASQLTPGDAVTAWWVVFNNPEFCGGPCGVNDLGTPEVEAALVYADGQVVDADGRATFASTLVERDISYVDPAHTGLPGAGIGLSDAQATEVHVVLRTHGAASDDADMRTEQLTSFNGGCAPECTNLQGTEHLAVGRHVSLAPMVQFSDPSVHIGDKSDTVSRMTRDDDSVSVQVEASQLTPGDAVTAWWVVFNNPEFCGGPCGVNDLGTPEVEAALVYADGQVVDADGRATFASTLVERDISYVDPAHTGLPGAGIGLSDAQATEVHVVLRTHGAVSDDAAVRTEQLTSFNGGCAPECTNLQGTEHESPMSTVQITTPFQIDPDRTLIEGASARLTRAADSVTVRADTAELTPGDAVTSWVVVFNNPEHCEGPCNGADLQIDEVNGGLALASRGIVVPDDGTATFVAQLEEGELLRDAGSAEIHFVVRTKGPASDDPAVLERQLTELDGGCDPADPDKACKNIQGALFAVDQDAGDFDRSGIVSASDIDLLFAAVRNGNSNPLLDVNGDGAVDGGDVDDLIANIIGTHRGDSNLDGEVDFGDFLTLSANFGQQGGWSEGDSNGDGLVDFADYLALATGFSNVA